MFDLNAYLSAATARIDRAMDMLLPPAATEPARIHEAMRYSLFAGGKRLRPVLCLASAEAAGGSDEAALIPASSLEMYHTFTLIHDDLPAMDDDDLRRGRPTCHVAFDEATAILAGDALLVRAFEILCDASCRPPYGPVDLIRELARAGGSQGVMGGQMADIEGEGKPLSVEQLLYIHTHKTGDLIRAAVRMGAMTTGTNEDHLSSLTQYAEKIGLAFQIADDVLNATSSADQLGKASGTDAAAGKMTYVAAYGVDGAKKMADDLIVTAKALLRQLPGDTQPLAALADYITARKK